MGKKYYQDTSPLAMGKQQKGSSAQKQEQRRKKKQNERAEVQTGSQSSSNVQTSAQQRGRQTSQGSRQTQQTQTPQRQSTYRSVRSNTARRNVPQTAEEMRRQRQSGVDEALRNKRDPLGINQQKQTVKNRYDTKNPQTAEETRKLKEQEKEKQSRVMDTKSAPSYYGASMKQGEAGKFGKDLADTVGHTLKQTAASESRMFWESAKGKNKTDPFIRNIASEEEIRKADEKADRNIRKYGERIEKESLALENLKEGHSWLGQRTLEATSSGVGMLTDIAWGPASLGHMWVRSTGTARGQVTRKAEALRSNLEKTGLYSPEELDEMFSNTDEMDMLNAGINGGIEVLSEKLFTGIGVAKKVGGTGILDRMASRLINKVGGKMMSGPLGRMLMGTAEEITEEEVGNPLQTFAANLIYGNKFQDINEDATKRMLKQESDALISQIASPEQAQIIATRLSSEEFMEESVESYKEAGFTDKESQELAEKTRDYLEASLTGDTEKMEELRQEMAITMTSGDKSMQEHWGLQDAIDVAVSTAIMTSVSGVPGTINSSKVGNAYKNSAGMDAVKNLAEITANWDADASDKAQSIVDRINSGEDITGTQVAELIGQASEAATRAMQDEDSKWQVAQRQMKDKDLRISPATRTEDGTLVLSENTQQRYDQIVKQTVDRYAGLEKIGQSEGISTQDVELGADLAAAQMTGVISAEQINELVKPENKGARQVFEEVTSIDLSQFNKYDRSGLLVAETNIAIRKGLMASAASNLVNSARLEQVAWNDDARGEVGEIMRARMDGEGSKALMGALDKVDPRDRDVFILTGEAARTVYAYGRYTLDDWANVRRNLEGNFKGVDMDSLKAVFEAAKEDKAKAENEYYGKAVKAQEEMTRSSLSEGEQAYVPGKFTNESERSLKGSEIETLSSVASELGIDIIMSDELDANENGRYDYRTRTIYLNSRNTMGENLDAIFSHEVTHHLAVFAPDEYIKLSEFVMDRWFKENPAEFKRSIERIQKLYKEKRNQDLSDEQALEELIADGTYSFWQDERFMRDITQVEPTLAQKIINSIRDFLRKLRRILSSGNITDEEARRGLFELIDGYETAYNLWMNAYNTARKGQAQQTIDEWQERANRQSDNDEVRHSLSDEDRETLNEQGIDITDGGSAVRYSLASWTETDQEALLERLVAAGFEREVAQKWLDDVNSVASIIHTDMERLNYEADRFQPALKPNSEYYYTLDLSTLCQKRRLYQGTYNAIMDKIVNRGLKPNDTVRLRQMMSSMNHEVPCGICYEESRKKNEGKFAETWLNGQTDKEWNQKLKEYDKKVAEYEALEDKGKKKPPKKPERWLGYANMEHTDPYIPTIADVTTTTGRDRLRAEGHTEALEAYLDYQKGRGSANPKVSFTHTDYRGDILRLSDSDIEKVKHIGGLRIQSFSDFEVVHVIDMMQAVMDMASKKLTAQAYTKVPAFADIFGGTGIKINLSLIQKMDENGNPVYDSEGRLVFDPIEGIDPEEAIRIREKYSNNVGTILVGVSRQQILDAWADDRVDMVIPFHRSGWSLAEFEKLGLKGYEDFQAYQAETYWDGSKWISLKDAKMEGIYPVDYWNDKLSGRENAEAYLKLCAEKHYRPVFYNFLHDNGDGTWSLPTEEVDGYTADGYWKSLIDYKMYNNEGEDVSKQSEVQPVFDMDVAEDVMSKYEGNADTLPVAEDVVEAYIKDYKKRYPKAKLNLDGDVRLSLAIDYDEAYMDAVNSGNMEEAQRLVDEAANTAGFKPVHRYHGTMDASFTVFDKAYAKVGGNSGAGFYFSTEEDDSANHYADVEGADNYYKWSELAEAIWDTGELPNGEEAEGIESYEDAVQFAKDYLNKSPGTFDVYLNYKNPYVRNFRQSTDILPRLYDDFDESLIDRNDYDDEDDYYDAVRDAEYEHIYQKINDAVYGAYYDLDNFYEIIDSVDLDTVVNNIFNDVADYERLTWDDIAHAVGVDNGWMEVIRDDWSQSAVADIEFVRAIVENFGYDAVEDKEVSSKFGQLSREMMTDTEHIIVFKPEQIKLSDPITYAEDGSVIPLSERFDPNNDDIRYSMATTDSEGRVLTDGQMEYFKNSQARDEQGRLAVVYHTTNRGGFTVFDPTYSDDKRSLFFSDNFSISQSYAEDAASRVRFSRKPYKSLAEFERDADKLLVDEEGWDSYKTLDENLDPYIVHRDTLKGVIGDEDIWWDDWLSMQGTAEADKYSVEISLPGEQGRIIVNTLDEMLAKLSEAMSNLQHGYYACYLNLENPMIIEGRGQYWDAISQNESKMPRDAHIELYTGDYLLEKAQRDDERYKHGMGWRDGSQYRKEGNRAKKRGEVVLYFENGERIPVNNNDESIAKAINTHYGLDETDNAGMILANNLIEGADEIFPSGKVKGNAWLNGSMIKAMTSDSYSTRGWAKIAQEQGYDGVIFRDIIDIGTFEFYGDEEEMASDIYIAFSSEQVKDVNNENPTENPDIRYSVVDEDDALEWLASQYELDEVPAADAEVEEGRVRMAKSKEEFVRTKNTLWNERWLTEGKVLDVKSVRKSIRNVVMGAMANSDTKAQYRSELVDRTLVAAKSAFWLMKSGKYEEAAMLLWDAAYDMIQDVEFIEDTAFKQYKGLRDYLRTAYIRLGEEYWSDVDYAAFRKRNMGRIRLVKGDTNVDQILDELMEIAPEWFREEAFEKNGLKQESVPDILLQMEAVLDAIQPYRIAYSSEEAEELASYIADDLYDIVYEGKEYKSVADTYKQRYDAKTKALKQRHEEAMRDFRNRRDELLSAEKEKTARQKERADLWKSRTFEEKAKRQKDKDVRKHAKYFGKISDNIDWLTDRLINETKDKNIPEGFRRSLAHLLLQFDMQTERSKQLEAKYGPAQKTLRMADLQKKLEKIAKEDDTGEFRYDGYLFYLMDALADKVDGKTIDALDTEDLIVIDTMLKSIRHNFTNYNKIRINEEKVAIARVGDATIQMMRDRIEKYGQRAAYKSAVISGMDRLLNEGEETPIYFFERLDPEGNGIGAMYKELRRGEDTHIRNIDFLRQRFKQMFGEYFNDKNPGSETLESWRDDSQSQTFNLKHGTITLNPAQIMSLYCLSKRTQAMGHILGAGIVASPVTFGAKMKDGVKAVHEQVESVMITHDEVLEIISKLTPEQVKLADEMQSLLNNEMAAWGNETSLEMYGIKLFREKDYFPIKSSSESLAKTADSFEAQEKIKNFGFTKPLVKNANNAIMIDDIFSVVADHCNKMALYNAMAIPISDFMRVYNYKQTDEEGAQTTVQQMIGEAFTRKANAYIMKFLGDVNGNTKTKSDAVDALMNKALANYKKASIGMNMRVALQQPTAIFRSLMVIDPKHFKGVKVSRKAMQEMFEHCPIALWKSWGHYDMDMGRDIEDIMMNNDWSKWDAISMGIYGELDNLTWSIMWQAVKNEVRKTHPDVKEGSQEFWDLCNERASEVFDKTQVVDSIFHRSDTMRSKNTLTKMATSFMAEPTLTYNVFRDSLAKARDMMKDGKTGEAAKLIGKMILVLGLNAAAVSASAALWDAVRGKGDDDDDDTRFAHLWLVNFMNNFGENINMINNIYFVKDIWSLKDGWGTSNMALEGWETLFKGYSQAKKKITEGSKKTWYEIMMNLLGGAGYITGVPVKTMMRDLKAIADKLGIDVFAADDSFDEIDQKKTNSIVDSLFEKIGYRKKEESVADEDASGVPSKDDLPDNLTDEQKDDIIKSAEKRSKKAAEKEAEQGQLDYDDMLYKALKAASGLEGEEYNKKVYSSVANGLKGYIADGDYMSIGMMRSVIEEAGGDVDYFDKRVLEESKTAFKKSLGYDLTHEQRWAMKSQWRYMVNHGMTEEEISSDIIYKSDLAKDMKVAYRIGDNGTIYQAMIPLVDAGLMESDLQRLYENRNRMDLSKYDGRYKDRLKSTGNFIWPTEGVLTSGFGRRSAPTKGASSYHSAIDIGAPQGTPVVAADGGEVIEAGKNGGYGNSVGIRHDDGTITYYNHLYAWNVKVGDTVAQGQQIGQVGSTGISTGPHLDFRMYKDGEYLNPEKYLNKRS